MNRLNLEQDFWRDKNELFQQVDKQRLDLLNTDVTRRRSHAPT
jgi:hypothetical protein